MLLHNIPTNTIHIAIHTSGPDININVPKAIGDLADKAIGVTFSNVAKCKKVKPHITKNILPIPAHIQNILLHFCLLNFIILHTR